MDMEMKDNIRTTRGKTENADAVSCAATKGAAREGDPQGPAEESPARLIESYRRVPCLSESVVLDIDEVVYERMDGLVQAIGREDVTTGSFVSRVISEHLERHADMIRIIEEQGQKRQ